MQLRLKQTAKSMVEKPANSMRPKSLLYQDSTSRPLAVPIVHTCKYVYFYFISFYCNIISNSNYMNVDAIVNY